MPSCLEPPKASHPAFHPGAPDRAAAKAAARDSGTKALKPAVPGYEAGFQCEALFPSTRLSGTCS